MNNELLNTVKRDLEELAGHIGARPTGSTANREAAGYITKRFGEYGWEIETQGFETLDWNRGRCELLVGGEPLQAHSKVSRKR